MLNYIKKAAKGNGRDHAQGKRYVRVTVLMLDGTPSHSEKARDERAGYAIYNLFSKMENVAAVFLTVEYWANGYCVTSQKANHMSIGVVLRHTNLYRVRGAEMVMYQGERPPLRA